MAWPGSRFTSFVPNNVPVISASYINAQQDWTAAITNDTVSVVGLQVDGVGGQAKVAVPGAMKWTNTITGGGNPSHSTPLSNELRALNTPKAWIRFATDGAGAFTVLDGANIAAMSLVPGTSFAHIILAQPMVNTNYSVVCGASDPAGAPQNPALYPSNGLDVARRPTTGQFYILFPVGFRPDTTPVECCLHVFGRQTT